MRAFFAGRSMTIRETPACAGASAASLVPAQDPARVLCVHLCGAAPPAEAVREDVVAFARELAQRSGDGLGWS